MEPQRAAKPVRKVHEFVQTVCGIYSRVARRLRVSPSFVSRVARGERQSPAVEKAVMQEFAEAKTDLMRGKL
jgi:DNA-binding transcriptional regulator YdaS (Cro superfamily)